MPCARGLPEDPSVAGALAIGGLQRHSLIDFPGVVACVVFTRGCNFRCPYCHNPQLVEGDGPPPVEPDFFWDFVARRRGLLDGVVITGGEPLLQAGLGAFCARLRREGLRVKLDTNGSRPEALARLLAHGLVDYVAMDLKTAPEDYGALWPGAAPDRVRQSLDAVMGSGVAYEVRITCVHPLVNAAAIETLAGLLRGARRVVLQRFRSSGALLRPEAFGPAGCHRGCLEDEMRAFQARLAPLVDACDLR